MRLLLTPAGLSAAVAARRQPQRGRSGGPAGRPGGPALRPQGPVARRWVERGWPTTRQARRSDTPNCSRMATTALRRLSGVRIFPGQLLQHVDVQAWSATIRLRRWFSFSSSFNFLTSSAFMPPYWFRQRCQVDSVISKCLTPSSILLPSPSSFSPSASLRMTCSGVAAVASWVQSSSLHFGDRTRTSGGSGHGDPVKISTVCCGRNVAQTEWVE